MADLCVASVSSERFASCEEWRARFESGAGLAQSLEDTYGGKDVVRQRCSQLQAALHLFEVQYPEHKEEEVLLFRAPGRVNLRGMHIDQHGGACNAVAFDRETIAVAAVTQSPEVTVVTFRSTGLPQEGEKPQEDGIADLGRGTVSLDADAAAAAAVAATGWQKYLIGSVRALCDELQASGRPQLRRGVRMVLLSDIPQGAGVSSSHALIVSFLATLQAANKVAIPNLRLLQIAKLAERYSGTSTGLSDQGAILLSQRDRVLHANFYEGDVDGIASTIRYAPFPRELRIVVVNSLKERNLAGDAAVGYAVPRFAYSLAQSLLQKAAAEAVGEGVACKVDRIANISPEVLESVGGAATALELVKSLPQRVSVAGLLEAHPDLASVISSAEEAYLKGLPVTVEEIPMRGPLLFGITECERARAFFRALVEREEHNKEDCFATLGRLMTAGHMGDHHDSALDVTDDMLSQWCSGLRDGSLSLAMIPGSFRASLPELDRIQAAMVAANAYGASLTGGGMGGCVVGLFPADGIDATVASLRKSLEEEYYSKLEKPPKHIDSLVFAVRPIAGAAFL